VVGASTYYGLGRQVKIGEIVQRFNRVEKMKIEIFEKQEDTGLKKPYLKITESYLLAVNSDGSIVAHLISFSDLLFIKHAKNKLTNDGFTTDWANWDEDGRLRGFT
jgi:hypothetical protein